MGVIRGVAETGLPILLVEQNVMQVLEISDRTYIYIPMYLMADL